LVTKRPERFLSIHPWWGWSLKRGSGGSRGGRGIRDSFNPSLVGMVIETFPKIHGSTLPQEAFNPSLVGMVIETTSTILSIASILLIFQSIPGGDGH